MAACTSDIKFLLLQLPVTKVNDKLLAMVCHSVELSKFKACHVIIILLSFLLLFLLEADGNWSCKRRAGSERKLKVNCPLLPIYSPRVDKTVVTADWVMKTPEKVEDDTYGFQFYSPAISPSLLLQCCRITMFSFNCRKCTILVRI